MLLKKNIRLYLIQVVFTLVGSGFLSILYLKFFQQSIALSELFLAEGIASFVVVFYILFRPRFKARRDFTIGFALVGLALLILLLPFSRKFFYLYTIFRSLGIIIFFIHYNILHFENPVKGRNLENMTWYWGLMIVPGILGPIMGAALLTYLNIGAFVAVALAILAYGIYLVYCLPPANYFYSSREIWGHLKNLRVVNMLDGALHKVTAAVSIFALLYINKEMDYGNYLAIISLVALVAALAMAKQSDRSNRRMGYIWIFSIASGITAAAFGWVHSFGIFLLLTLILKALSVLVEPARANIILDTVPSSSLNWVSRELYLNLGRGLLYIAIFLLIQFNFTVGVFILLGLLHVIFPLLVHQRKVYAA